MPRLTGKQLDEAAEAVEKIAMDTRARSLARMKYTAGGAGFEGAQEGASQVLQNWIEKGYNPDPRLGLMDGALESAAWGAWGGGFFGGARDIHNWRKERNQQTGPADDKPADPEVGLRMRGGHGAMTKDIRGGFVKPGARAFLSDRQGNATIPVTVQEIAGDHNAPMIRYVMDDGTEGTLNGLDPNEGFVIATQEAAPPGEEQVDPEEKDPRYTSGLEGRGRLDTLMADHGEISLRLKEGDYADEIERAEDIAVLEDIIQQVESIRKKEASTGDIAYSMKVPPEGLNKTLVAFGVQANAEIESLRNPEQEQAEEETEMDLDAASDGELSGRREELKKEHAQLSYDDSNPDRLKKVTGADPRH